MYYVLYALFFAFSLLPMRILYLVSDLIFLFVYYVLGYRRKVVFDNLKSAFPEKTEHEREQIAKRFYHNLLDSFIETIKLFSAGQTFLQKRVTANWEVLEPLFKSGKSCQLHLGHTFNWEWGHHVLTANTAYNILVVYMPVSNAAFERMMYKLRTRYGNTFIAAGSMSKAMSDYKGKQYLLGLVADQSPGAIHNAYWTIFLGKPTAFVSGPEKGAKAANIPVVFATITKPRRGYYHATLELACEDPSTLAEGMLTLRYANFMEMAIRKNPEMWLWSHRRWKHSWNPQYEKNWIGDFPDNLQSDQSKVI
jgi:KDO2-lipid IV(A) lauroyltransferase